jgi:hypothetical protein
MAIGIVTFMGARKAVEAAKHVLDHLHEDAEQGPEAPAPSDNL